ncbi:hypothetical protein [Clostridium saccharoperbutylacetonicum]|uniref:hypothetical protein n=1 Tax=Clostridium saccharoperbutylacetonicum TaxID=36745 RepID=UPI0039EAFC47
MRNLDLPGEVRFGQGRKEKTYKGSELYGGTCKDSQNCLEKNKDVMAIQMDSLIGRAGGKVFLIVHFVESNLMLAF